MTIVVWTLLTIGILAFAGALVSVYFDVTIGVFGGFALSLVFLVAGAVCAVIQDSREWDAFAATHACVKVGHMSGSTFNTIGVGPKGGVVVGVGSTSDKSGYQCNDGVTYWR